MSILDIETRSFLSLPEEVRWLDTDDARDFIWIDII
jgi:hypothetical protein